MFMKLNLSNFGGYKITTDAGPPVKEPILFQDEHIYIFVLPKTRKGEAENPVAL